MTDLQKQQIKALRIDGIGYKAIATKVGLSRDAVRQYCKRNGLDGFGDAAKLNAELHNKESCKLCGTALVQALKVKPKIFCSKECREKWWSQNHFMKNKNPDAVYKLTCLYCGKAFESYGNKHRKYDTHQCYIKHRFGE